MLSEFNNCGFLYFFISFGFSKESKKRKAAGHAMRVKNFLHSAIENLNLPSSTLLIGILFFSDNHYLN